MTLFGFLPLVVFPIGFLTALLIGVLRINRRVGMWLAAFSLVMLVDLPVRSLGLTFSWLSKIPGAQPVSLCLGVTYYLIVGAVLIAVPARIWEALDGRLFEMRDMLTGPAHRSGGTVGVRTLGLYYCVFGLTILAIAL